METKNYAAIDIGSNAVRLLIKGVVPSAAEEDKDKMIKNILLRVPLRLGFDVFSNGEISPAKEENLVKLMKSYKHLMNIYNVVSYRACATSAMRDARNGKDIIKKIKKKTGIEIEIIDGKEEAKMTYNSHLDTVNDRNGSYMYVDVGGGSTEVNLLINGKIEYTKSFNIGTVRTLMGGVSKDDLQKMKQEITEQLKNHSSVNIIGSGGNIIKLYKLIGEKGKKQKRFSVESLREMLDTLRPMSLEERMEKFGMKADRADVIVPAAEIFLNVAEAINAKYIYVPMIGLSDGIIDRLYAADRDSEK